MTSGPNLCIDKVLVRWNSNETIDDTVHHDRFCLSTSLLKGRPFQVLDHDRGTTHTVVIVEYISSASTAYYFEFDARLLGAWVLNSRSIL